MRLGRNVAVLNSQIGSLSTDVPLQPAIGIIKFIPIIFLTKRKLFYIFVSSLILFFYLSFRSLFLLPSFPFSGSLFPLFGFFLGDCREFYVNSGDSFIHHSIHTQNDPFSGYVNFSLFREVIKKSCQVSANGIVIL